MTILSDDIRTKIEEKDVQNVNDVQNIQSENKIIEESPQESLEQKQLEEFRRYKQMQSEQTALGLAPRTPNQDGHITDIFKEKAKEFFNNYEEADKFLNLLDLKPDNWEKENNLLLTKEAKERYVDRTLGMLNNISENKKSKEREYYEFSEWKLNKDFGSETLAGLKLVSKEKFCMSTGLDPEDYDALPQTHKEKMYRKIHQDHLNALKGNAEKVSLDIRDPNKANILNIAKEKGLIK